MRRRGSIWDEWAELHAWVEVEKELVVTEDGMSWHDDSRLVNLSLALDLECGVVKAESALHSKV